MTTRDLLKSALSHEFQRLKPEDPRYYESEVKKGESPLQLALAQFEGGKAMLAVLEFKFDVKSKSLKTKEHYCPGDCVDGSRAYYLGQHER